MEYHVFFNLINTLQLMIKYFFRVKFCKFEMKRSIS
jgi:hypothetical protein